MNVKDTTRFLKQVETQPKNAPEKGRKEVFDIKSIRKQELKNKGRMD